MELNDLQQNRLLKLQALQVAGVDPFPVRVPEHTHTISAQQTARGLGPRTEMSNLEVNICHDH
jgi:hypothetical protein